MIDEEVRLMQENPGGKGVDIGYTTDDRGNINGRWAQSNNPQWYQDAYKRLGRKPTKADLPFLAEDRLHAVEEFDTLDRELSHMRVLRDYMREHPEESFDRAMDQADAGTLVQGERRIGPGERAARPLEKTYTSEDDNQVIHGYEVRTRKPRGWTTGTAKAIRREVRDRYKGQEFENRETGMRAVLGKRDAGKMVSFKALAKSIRNGFSAEEHFQTVLEAPRLFEQATLLMEHADRRGRPNIEGIARFQAIRKNGSIVKLTVRK